MAQRFPGPRVLARTAIVVGVAAALIFVTVMGFQLAMVNQRTVNWPRP